MVKKGRLGSDPLSWIGDSRNEDSNNQTLPSPKAALEIPLTDKEQETAQHKAPAEKSEPVKNEPAEKSGARETAKQIVKSEPVKIPEILLEPVKEKKAPENKNLQSRSMELLNKSQDTITKKTDLNVKKNLEHEGKYLTFVLANEEYGLEINRVKEINGLLPITRVPRTPQHIVGVINLRGKIVSVIDMRLKFGMEKIASTQETCIIVVQSKHGEKGILVDKVSEVINIQAEEIESVPEFGVSINTDYILGIGKIGTNVIILLDIDKILSVNQVLDETAG